MLIDKEDSDIFPLGGEIIECLLNGTVFGLVVDDQKVPLRIGRLCDMLRDRLGVLHGVSWVDIGSYSNSS